ncbi:hypothetical protein C2845_PM03G01090 [Panicum miliaceum]|uniref:Uncharacterized protein n=1 Tax=Panicum miliaceum TaxID=4540 RepID=A0A3L6T9L8_PANMI|nr:hypothetical protein C2845_PM03G01090 [Panicum miliaceum]
MWPVDDRYRVLHCKSNAPPQSQPAQRALFVPCSRLDSMARILASGGGAGAAASAALGSSSSWLFGPCMVVVSVWIVSFAVFICGRSSHGNDDRPAKKKPAPAPAAKKPAAATKAKPSGCGGTARSSRTVADSTSMYTAAYMGGAAAAAAACGCSAGHGGGGCGGGGGGGC